MFYSGAFISSSSNIYLASGLTIFFIQHFELTLKQYLTKCKYYIDKYSSTMLVLNPWDFLYLLFFDQKSHQIST